MSVIIRGKNPKKPYTVRYWVNGRQRERSFALLKGSVGAEAFMTKTDNALREQIYVDDKLGRELFCGLAETWIERHQCADRTRKGLLSSYRAWVKPAFTGRSVAQVAADRDAVCDLLQVKMRGMSITGRERVRQIIVSTVAEAVRQRKIQRHELDGIALRDAGSTTARDAFVFPEFAQVQKVGDAVGIAVWLMRGCGLRAEEALAVHREDFMFGGKTLRLSGQATEDGRRKVALKHRKEGEYRDIPVPAWLWALVKDMPAGPLSPGNGRAYRVYGSVLTLFGRVAERAGIPAGFRPHSLRHAYVSTLLGRGVPLTDIAPWVGHRDISKLYKTYGHLLPRAEDKALAALAADYAEWSAVAA